MNEINDGGPAFPEVPGDRNGYEGKSGMTLRDYFAAKAMESLALHQDLYSIDTAQGIEAIAANAYDLADAMLRARGSA
ncbi:hypothetical protein QZM82_06520 [Burkholderia cepacia]|uniref:hypothetical protein n=1 Tax=Burkholderia cepacia TaxID=292 RepID=UPI002654549D|nr:hypothetical protein [Burkholderia cepacia]MDN7895847.1 hypothetical protein [Burkholderia cepacia]